MPSQRKLMDPPKGLEESAAKILREQGQEPVNAQGFDVIHKPKHYNVHPSGIEPIQITKYETFFRGNIIKYVMRAPYKGSELEDLEKAREYLDREIEFVKEKQREAQWAAIGPADALFQTVPQ